ncbi:VOC family protein [Protaetiibacter mangrovi]|uniref:VOC family protein n=1 Tax=Protaetiibacter mangrovi TaxID=2970926 RepID=A0ABT1ZE42_9MICO|nr:VOC family protein [Protaetiibacter mangrovi]MCS0498967.1 VOC family protein [Protaetiibacter mangrovi]
MPLFDHLGITVSDLDRAIAQWDPVLTALGLEREEGDANGAAWYREGETELILMPAREPESGPHRHGTVGWQHLAFAIDTRAEVDRLHDLAVSAGWTEVREPKPYPRFTARYYAAFLEDADGIRIEFMFNGVE